MRNAVLRIPVTIVFLLAAASVKALSQWRFKADGLPSIKQFYPSSNDPFANEDLLIAVPVHFQL
jgi:hypothetical protein